MPAADRDSATPATQPSDHPAPPQQVNHRRNFRVVLENSQAREDRVPVMLHVVRVARRDQRQSHGSRIRHIGRRVQPVLEEKEPTESKCGSLPLREEISG